MSAVKNSSKCSFFGISGISCGDSRGHTGVVNLLDCDSDITTHLAACNLSRSALKEYEVILSRSGLFDIVEDKLQFMQICPSHRDKLKRLWRPLRSCQYPSHEGPLHKYKTRSVFNTRLSREVMKMYGSLVQIGSRKYNIH